MPDAPTVKSVFSIKVKSALTEREGNSPSSPVEFRSFITGVDIKQDGIKISRKNLGDMP